MELFLYKIWKKIIAYVPYLSVTGYTLRHDFVVHEKKFSGKIP
jgi:hypothetical protein